MLEDTLKANHLRIEQLEKEITDLKAQLNQAKKEVALSIELKELSNDVTAIKKALKKKFII